MSDSGSSSLGGETRMLERRVSNNRTDLNGDGQMNYFLSWFNTWSELQKSDFVDVLAGKMSSTTGDDNEGKVNGLSDQFKSMDCNSSRPPSLFSCQVKLFRDWFGGWSDDQKNYLVLRLQEIDAVFYSKYEDRITNPGKEQARDYFEPGVPIELVKHSKKDSVVVAPDVAEDDEEEKKASGGSAMSDDTSLSTISED